MNRQQPITTLVKSIVQILLVMSLLLPVSFTVAASDAFDPIRETLQYRQKKGYMDAAPSGQDKPLEQVIVDTLSEGLPVEIQPSALERTAAQKSGELTLQVERQGQALDGTLEQFGYNIFEQAGKIAAVGNLAVPGDYRVGSGDTLIVQLYGKRNVEYQLVVTREGKLLIPDFGPVTVGGLTFDEARGLIVSGFESRVIGAKAVVTMGELRTIQVRITGEVNAPGAYALSGLSTLMDLLFVSGGVNQSGSLRNISVMRDGQRVALFDLYDLLTRGDASGDIVLQHNDVIFVPPIGDVVYVGGEVQRPAIYELSGETRIKRILELAGGLLPTASLADSHLERIVNGQYRTLISLGVESGFGENLRISAGDFIRIMPLDSKLDYVVMLSGHVKRPGAYQLKPAMRVSELIPSAEVLLRNADLDVALLKREDAISKRTLVQYLDLAEILRSPGSEADLQLQPRDQVFAFSLAPGRSDALGSVLSEVSIQATEYRPASIVSVIGHARFTGRFPLAENARLLDVLGLVGGVQSDLDLNYGIVARTSFPGGRVTVLRFRLGAALAEPEGQHNLEILPADRIYLFDSRTDRSALLQEELTQLRRQASFTSDSLIVSANGLVNIPGDFPMTPGMQASDLLCAADGLRENARGLAAELSRFRSGADGKPEIEHLLLDTQALVAACSSIRTQARELGESALRRKSARVVEDKRLIRDVIDPVHFEGGMAWLDAEDLQRIEIALSQYRDVDEKITVVVAGHTDNRPLSPETAARHGGNKGLSLARAKQVAAIIEDYLKGSSVSLKLEGHGATIPVASNETEAGRYQNRRVEVHLSLPSQVSIASAENVHENLASVATQKRLPIDVDPLLVPGDQLTFTEKPGWTEVGKVELGGEVMRPGTYVIDRGETLCAVMRRAGGLAPGAWPVGAEFMRVSTREMQQQTLDAIQDQLDDLMVELSLSHSANNQEKTPSGTNKEDYMEVLRQLKKAEASGREVIDLERAMTCHKDYDLVLESGDKLNVPLKPRLVTVVGQVYVPTSHAYVASRTVRDYIDLSGGSTVIGRLKDAYAVQPNGEILSKRALRKKPMPGARIYVPLNVDRMNTTEKLQSWTRSLVEVALFAGVIL